jgi:putative oxidoreductase
MQADLGRLILRLTVGGLLLLHGMQKVINGIAPIASVVIAHGLPPQFAYAVYLGEVVAPILLILGVFVRLGGLLVVANMIVAVLLGGMESLFSFNDRGGYALEVEAFYLFCGLSVALLGAGRLSVARGRYS